MFRWLRRLAGMARVVRLSAHRIRYEVSKPWLAGCGIELGAGASPQRLPEGASAEVFDKRSGAELTELFGETPGYVVRPLDEIGRVYPDGADFLIAHNVLEHIHGEIRALIAWYGYVKDGGTVVVSVPDKRFFNEDRPRLTAGFDHLLLDYALERGEEWLETREHVLSFCLGWADSWSEMSKEQFVAHMLSETQRDGHDCHWHALDREGWDRVVAASGLLGGFGIEVLACVDAESDDPLRTHGEIVYVYRVSRHDRVIHGLPEIGPQVAALRERLARGGNLLAPPSDPAGRTE